MAKVERFEDLYAWQLSRRLVNAICDLTILPTFKDFSLKDQIQRAVISVLSNIAEGFERGNREELLYFLYIAKGSCGEVRAQLYVALDRGFIRQSEFQNALSLCQNVSAVLHKFIQSIKASKFRGLRYKEQKIESEADKFLKELAEKYPIPVGNQV